MASTSVSRASVDVDSLINRHRQRLEEHRKFLDGDNAQPYHSPTLEVREGLFDKPSAAAAQQQQQQQQSPHSLSTVANPSSSSQPDTPRGGVNHRSVGGVGERMMPRGGAAEEYHYPAAASAAATQQLNNTQMSFDNTSGVDTPSVRAVIGGNPKPQLSSNFSNISHASSPLLPPSSSAAGAAAGGVQYDSGNNNSTLRARQQQHISAVQQQIEQQSKYYTNSPTRMYERSQAWLAGREQKLINTYHEVYRGEEAECTFHPETHTRAYSEHFQHHHYAAASSSSGGGGGAPAMIDVGEANFIERQRAARLLKEEAMKKMLPDTSRWQNRRTVPKEFDLGKRDTAIPSLKKPAHSYMHQQQANDANGSGNTAVAIAGGENDHHHDRIIAHHNNRNKRATTPPAHVGFGVGAQRAVSEGNNNGRSRSGQQQQSNNSRKGSPVVTGASSTSTSERKPQKPNNNDNKTADDDEDDANFEPEERNREGRKVKVSDNGSNNNDNSSISPPQQQNNNNNNFNDDLRRQQQEQQNEKDEAAAAFAKRVSADVEALKAVIRHQQQQIEQLTQGLSLAQRELVVARATIRDLSLNPQ